MNKDYLGYDSNTHRKCGKHGLQLIEMFYSCPQKTRHGKPTVAYRCKLCSKVKESIRYNKDKEASKAATNAWRRANKEEARKIVTKCYNKNKEKFLEGAKDRRHETRMEILKHYSGGIIKCALCDENHERLLVLGTIDGGGTAHKKNIDCFGQKFYDWIVKNGYPEGYRILCHNCAFKENMRRNREKFENKVWDEENSFQTYVVGGKEYEYDKQERAIKSAIFRQNRKLECLMAYSSTVPKCVCCGKYDIEILSIDHVDGGGKKHRREVGDGHSFYKWLKSNNYPEGYRVLCFSCNFAIGAYKECPHKSTLFLDIDFLNVT